GFWIIGAGCELAYHGWLGTHPRFQHLVEGGRLLGERRRWQERLLDLLRQLPPEDQQRYRTLQGRCEGILEQQAHGAAVSTGLQEQGEGLGRLVWIYLRLLLIRESIKRIIRESESLHEDKPQMEARISKLQEQLKQPTLSEDLRKSLTSQVEIVQQRLEEKGEAGEKLVFL